MVYVIQVCWQLAMCVCVCVCVYIYIYIYIYIYLFIYLFIYCRSCGTALGPDYICCSIQVYIIHKTWIMTQVLCIPVLMRLYNFASRIIYRVWTFCSFCVGCNINLFLMRIYVKHATCSKKKIRVLMFVYRFLLDFTHDTHSPTGYALPATKPKLNNYQLLGSIWFHYT